MIHALALVSAGCAADIGDPISSAPPDGGPHRRESDALGSAPTVPENDMVCMSEENHRLPLNPRASLQRAIVSAHGSFVPTSPEVSWSVYTLQRAESLLTGEVRVYYVRRAQPNTVRYVRRGAIIRVEDERVILRTGEAASVLRLNPNARLQEAIADEPGRWTPTSEEYGVWSGTAFTGYPPRWRQHDFIAQRAENLETGAVRTFYVPNGRWDVVYTIDRPAGFAQLCTCPCLEQYGDYCLYPANYSAGCRYLRPGGLCDGNDEGWFEWNLDCRP
jgi:hypothetical protein